MKKILVLLICAFLLFGCAPNTNKCLDGHSSDQGNVEVDNDGKEIMVYRCKVCNEVIKEEAIDPCAKGHTFDEGRTTVNNNDEDIIVFKCIYCDTITEKKVEYNEEYISFDNIYSKIHVDAKTSKDSPVLKIITTPMGISDCNQGKHQWISSEKQNITEVSYEISLTCSNCDKKKVETFYNSPKYIKDVFDTSVLTNKYYMSNYNALNSASFNEQQIKRIQELLQLMKNCEIYKTTYYDYNCIFKIGMHYNKNNIGGNYYLTRYDDCLVLQLNEDKYVIKDNEQFNNEMLNEFYEYFFVTENNIINEEYDLISATRLEYIYKNSKKNFNDFGFTELRGKNISVFNINIQSKEHLKEELDKKFSLEIYKKYNIGEIKETDNFYYVSVDYSLSVNSTYNTCFVAFKKDIFDIEKEIFYTKDKEIIKNILDTLQYSSIFQNHGSNLVHSEIEDFEDHYRYVKYDLQSSGGDWDVPDSVYFVRNIYEISKKTGEIKLINESSIKRISVSNNYTSYGTEVQENFIPHVVCFDITHKLETEMFSNFKQYINELKYENNMSSMYIDALSNYEAMKYVGFNYNMYCVNYDFVFFIHKKEAKENLEVDYSIFKNMIFYNGNIYITKINAERKNYTSIYNEGDIIVQLVLIPKKWSEKLNENSKIIINEYIEK